MPRHLKTGRDVEQVEKQNNSVRATVEATLADIAARGDAAVRDLSIKFDGWDRADYRLTDAEIRGMPERSWASGIWTTSLLRRRASVTLRSIKRAPCATSRWRRCRGSSSGTKTSR